jgi:hypothetical protein
MPTTQGQQPCEWVSSRNFKIIHRQNVAVEEVNETQSDAGSGPVPSIVLSHRRQEKAPAEQDPRGLNGLKSLRLKYRSRPHIGGIAKNMTSSEWSSTPSLSVESHIVPTAARHLQHVCMSGM